MPHACSALITHRRIRMSGAGSMHRMPRAPQTYNLHGRPLTSGDTASECFHAAG
jgi:hypothetical protein